MGLHERIANKQHCVQIWLFVSTGTLSSSKFTCSNFQTVGELVSRLEGGQSNPSAAANSANGAQEGVFSFIKFANTRATDHPSYPIPMFKQGTELYRLDTDTQQTMCVIIQLTTRLSWSTMRAVMSPLTCVWTLCLALLAALQLPQSPPPRQPVAYARAVYMLGACTCRTGGCDGLQVWRLGFCTHAVACDMRRTAHATACRNPVSKQACGRFGVLRIITR